MPRDARLLKIARALSDRPDDEKRMDAWAAWAGIAPRTLTRRFVAETGFSFTEWRQRVRLLRALELLAAGMAVTTIALDLGYENVSAFISLFRRSLGVTPGRYEASML
jgi:AraC-like DNA-binding protein